MGVLFILYNQFGPKQHLGFVSPFSIFTTRINYLVNTITLDGPVKTILSRKVKMINISIFYKYRLH